MHWLHQPPKQLLRRCSLPEYLAQSPLEWPCAIKRQATSDIRPSCSHAHTIAKLRGCLFEGSTHTPPTMRIHSRWTSTSLSS